MSACLYEGSSDGVTWHELAEDSGQGYCPKYIRHRADSPCEHNQTVVAFKQPVPLIGFPPRPT